MPNCSPLWVWKRMSNPRTKSSAKWMARQETAQTPIVMLSSTLGLNSAHWPRSRLVASTNSTDSAESKQLPRCWFLSGCQHPGFYSIMPHSLGIADPPCTITHTSSTISITLMVPQVSVHQSLSTDQIHSSSTSPLCPYLVFPQRIFCMFWCWCLDQSVQSGHMARLWFGLVCHSMIFFVCSE